MPILGQLFPPFPLSPTGHGRAKLSAASEFSKSVMSGLNPLIEAQNDTLDKLPEISTEFGDVECQTWLEGAILEVQTCRVYMYMIIRFFFSPCFCLSISSLNLMPQAHQAEDQKYAEMKAALRGELKQLREKVISN